METTSILGQSGIIITILLIMIPVLLAAILMLLRANRFIIRYRKQLAFNKFKERLSTLTPAEIEQLEMRQVELRYSLGHTELGSDRVAVDKKGLVDRISHEDLLPFIETKKRSQPAHNIDPSLARLIIWYLVSAAGWLVFGTTVGEYLGIKFSSPDIDHLSWLSFGRLRPVHTNAVFWGWASMAMMGLAYYVIPKTCNTSIYSIRKGYHTLFAMNATVLIGTILLMSGVNNGGGEYREYIWPVMIIFGYGIIQSLDNFLKTIARRDSKELYVSNWYIVSALIFLLIIAFVAYWPYWQNGLGETIVQGYYMHQGVGMWFMLFNLGLMYYFLPQQLNKPIYSYSLGILAFWSQILFYTLIGTHHFIFSSIPWWLQTIAIIGSAGMIIPVVAGTTNFLMTFRGSWNKVSHSYTLPFYLVGIICYFTGSLQGTAEAFRFTNLVWHFTDFTVAHSHLTMYGIITFMLWAFIYTIVPRITGKEPTQWGVGAHFWLALVGLLFYSIPLMIGATEKGLLWMKGGAFIDSVVQMKPYWLWRAIGGSLMWLSHLVFLYNLYMMIRAKERARIPLSPVEILELRQEILTTSK